MARRAKWDPGGLDPLVGLMGQCTLFALMMVRGLDYAAGDSSYTARRLGTVEAAAPIEVWGAAFALTACLGFLGLALRHSSMSIASHMAGWIGYWALGVGLVVDVAYRAVDEPAVVGGAPVIAGLALLAVGACFFVGFRRRWEYAPWVTGSIALCVTVGLLSSEWDGLRNASILLGVGTLHLIAGLGIAAKERQEEIRAERGVDATPR